MRALVLNYPRHRVDGRTMFGATADPIDFIHEPSTMGCSWKGVPLSEVPASNALRNITLRYGKDRFPVFEHVGPLVMMGLRKTRLETGRVVPHFSRTINLWNDLKRGLVARGELTPVTPRRQLQHSCGSDRNRYITYTPTSDGVLRLRVLVSYPDILDGKEHIQDYVFPDQQLMERIFAAPTLGRLSGVFRPLEPVVSRLSLFPVVKESVWRREYRPSESSQRQLLEIICDHRAVDIMGALSLATFGMTHLTGDIYSHRGGHPSDLRLILSLREPGMLVPV